ncbi:histone-lysine N-methyltransferase SETDB1-A-like isoform X2 [Cheilinus undulatus]|nr:histone-lysine N-methyltransferase SETDB1-A-like isoform X2 [Cheilinus undulatus]
MMETDEFEMCKDDLQKWIRERVKKQLVSTGLSEKYRLVQSLLKRRKEQTTQLLKLCNSVAAFEAVVKKQYSLLGWEYRDTDSEDDNRDDDDDDDNFDDDHDKAKNFGNASPLQTPSPASTKLLSPKLKCNENPTVDIVTGLKNKPVVVLKKLPDCKAKTTCPPSPQSLCSETDSLIDADSDTHWEPEDNLSDSDYSVSGFTSGTQKRRNVERRNIKPTKRYAEFRASSMTAVKRVRKSPPRACTDSKDTEKSSASQSAGAKFNAKCVRKSSTQASTDSNAKDNREKSTASQSAGAKIKAKTDTKSSVQTSMDSKAKDEKQKSPASQSAGAKTDPKSDRKSPTQASTDSSAKDKGEKSSASQSAGTKTIIQINTEKASKTPSNTNVPEASPIIISTAFAISPDETRNARPALPEVELTVGMTVLARKKQMRWQRGEIVEILTREEEDVRVKYKVNFEEKGKSLVSGHHMAFNNQAKLEELYVGARVVINCPDSTSRFQTAILAELPSRRNRLRFLVFTDDHVPIYVGLPLLHLVCRPLENALDDLPAGPHKSFMTRYLRDWPYPHLTLYKVGQNITVELEGAQQRCDVVEIDSSLMQVLFVESQKKEWIYRGSTRLEHMIRILRLREMEGSKDDSG